LSRPVGANRFKVFQARRILIQEFFVMLGTILLIILVLFLIGALPTWPHSANWGYFPSGGIGLILLIVIVLLLMGRI
jgi:hypothetical protein